MGACSIILCLIPSSLEFTVAARLGGQGAPERHVSLLWAYSSCGHTGLFSESSSEVSRQRLSPDPPSPQPFPQPYFRD